MCKTKNTLKQTLAEEFKQIQLDLRASMRSRTDEHKTLTTDVFGLIHMYVKDVVFEEAKN
jgi:hypothetical protein